MMCQAQNPSDFEFFILTIIVSQTGCKSCKSLYSQTLGLVLRKIVSKSINLNATKQLVCCWWRVKLQKQVGLAGHRYHVYSGSAYSKQKEKRAPYVCVLVSHMSQLHCLLTNGTPWEKKVGKISLEKIEKDTTFLCNSEKWLIFWGVSFWGLLIHK